MSEWFTESGNIRLKREDFEHVKISLLNMHNNKLIEKHQEDIQIFHSLVSPDQDGEIFVVDESKLQNLDDRFLAKYTRSETGTQAILYRPAYPDLVNDDPNHFTIPPYGDLKISFASEQRVIFWDVYGQYSVIERAHKHPLSVLFFSILDNMKWSDAHEHGGIIWQEGPVLEACKYIRIYGKRGEDMAVSRWREIGKQWGLTLDQMSKAAIIDDQQSHLLS